MNDESLHAEVAAIFFETVEERLRRLEQAVDELAGVNDALARRRLTAEVRDEAHGLRGGAHAARLADVAAAAARIEALAAGLDEDDLEVGAVAGRQLVAAAQALRLTIAEARLRPTREDRPAALNAAAVEPPVGPVVNVLCIEDDPASLTLAKLLVSTLPHVGFLEATTGREGLELARRERPSLILLDNRLPDLSGHDALRALAADPETRAIPVIVTSGDPPSPDDPAASAARRLVHLQKPIDPRELVATIVALLESDRTVRPEPTTSVRR